MSPMMFRFFCVAAIALAVMSMQVKARAEGGPFTIPIAASAAR